MSSKKNGDKFAEEGFKVLVHGSLECGWSIAQAERHDSILVMALVGSKNSFGDVGRLHENLVEALS